MENLVDIKCPFKKKGSKTGNLYVCNRVCVRVLPGSAGEAFCKSCYKPFEFEVDKQALMQTGVRVQPVEK